jgi:hypothetical protein
MSKEPELPHPEEDVYLLGIAKALSDGLPVDWEDTGEEAPEIRLMKTRLRFLQSVAEAYRRVRRG